VPGHTVVGTEVADFLGAAIRMERQHAGLRIDRPQNDAS